MFPEGGKSSNTFKSQHVFGAPYKKSTIFRRAEGANENFAFFATFYAADTLALLDVN